MSQRIRRFWPATALTPIVLLSSCSTTPVEASPAGHAASAECAKVSERWPDKVAGQSAYPVTTSSGTVRAWGSDIENAIVARCGVDSPAPTTDACIQVDDVDWVQTQIDGGYRFVTYGREPALEILVPKKASSTPGMLLPAFTATATAIKQGSHRCQ